MEPDSTRPPAAGRRAGQAGTGRYLTPSRPGSPGDPAHGDPAHDEPAHDEPTAAPGQADGWPLADRADELQAIARSLAGPQRRSVVIAGAAGAGRTRLAREALAAARRSGWRTQWVSGTGATSAIPLGAVAHLIPGADPAASPVTLVKRAVSALASHARGELAVGVDDAHLLDELSLAFVNRLALTGEVPLVLTVQSGQPVPDPVRALWKDGLAERLELRPLPARELDSLLRTVLGGIVDSRTCERLRTASGGNLVFLRELADGGREDGRLSVRDGVWRWEGSMSPTPRLAEIVRAEMGPLDAADRAVLELLALHQPTELATLARLASRETLTALERRGLLTVAGTGRGAAVRLAHPLYTEVVRQQIPEAAAPGLRRRLAGALGAGPSPDPRLAGLVLDGDGPPPGAGVLAEAAARANAGLDHRLAERLARAALAAGSGLPARTALIESLHWQGRAGEAEQVAADCDPQPLAAVDQSRFAIARALNLFFGLGRPDEASSTLLAAETALAGYAARHEVHAARAVLAFYSGRPQEAAAAGQAVSLAATSPVTRAWASAAASAALGVTGRAADGLAVAADGWAALADCPPVTGTAFIRTVLATGELLALLGGGRIGPALARTERWHEAALALPASAADAVASLHLGWARLASGKLRDAISWLTEAAAGLGQHDPAGLLHLVNALLAQARALTGEDPPGGPPPAPGDLQRHGAITVFEPEILLTGAVLNTEGDPALAVRLAHQAAAAAEASGQWSVQARSLHAIACLGHPDQVAGRLRQLARCADGPLAAAFAAHAEAAASQEAGRLDQVAAEFEAIGVLLPAAEAAAQAAAARERMGDRQGRAASAARAMRLTGACGRKRSPALRQLTVPALTSREQEVASLAGLGMSNREIADRLVVSVHTVETHLARSYSKLGITRRRELPEALEVAVRISGEPPAPGAGHGAPR